MRCRHHFRTRHPWLDPKTAGIHAGRPPGVRKEPYMKPLQVKGVSPFTLSLDVCGVLPARDGIRKPEGRRPWMAAGLGPSQDGEYETHHSAANALCGVDVTRKLLSLLTFFAAALRRRRERRSRPEGRAPQVRVKKVSRRRRNRAPPARAKDIDLRRQEACRSVETRPTGESQNG